MPTIPSKVVDNDFARPSEAGRINTALRGFELPLTGTSIPATQPIPGLVPDPANPGVVHACPARSIQRWCCTVLLRPLGRAAGARLANFAEPDALPGDLCYPQALKSVTT
jgi:hypothetical protein